MRKALLAAIALALAVSKPAAASDKEQPTKSVAPLSADEVAIDRAVLQQYAADGQGSLNVAATTYPLDPDSHMNGLRNGECLQGITLENLDAVAHSYHQLTPAVVPGKNIQLVDPKRQTQVEHGNDPSRTIRNGKSVDSAVKAAFATALFSMSEIEFDKGRQHAVVSYSFWCGSLCGNGATLVFEMTAAGWKKTNRGCGGWVS